VRKSEKTCVCCGGQRGYNYLGPVYCSSEELSGEICPWCIADGSAHEKYGAEFTDAAGIREDSKPASVSNSTLDELAFRTPGFTGWQQEHWLACCGDATAFLGLAGRKELKGPWSDAIASIQKDCKIRDERAWTEYFNALDKNEGPTAYIFQCLHCGKHLGYSDSH
jgi:hypothetical protein